MFDCCVVACVKLSEIQNFMKFKWEGIKGLSQNFIFFAFMISMNSNSFHLKTLDRRWHDFFHLNKWKGFWKYLNSIWGIFQIQKLYATQWFSWEKIKWLLRNIWNMSWKFKRIKFKIHLKLFFNLGYLSFIQIIFLHK